MLTNLMQRRGPDDEGIWTDQQHCTLGFRRLAILDLTRSGHQPMLSGDNRFVLVYNGELYNFQELKDDLARLGVTFRSTGDTEVILYALIYWGTDALKRFNGMFALALYDSVERRLLLARDHAGIKPLYYLHNSDGVVFASQYDQILQHPWSKDLHLNTGALGKYLRFGYIPAPDALLHRTYMVEPGTWIEIGSDRQIRRGRHFEFSQYCEPILYGEEAYEAVDAAISDAVKRQLISDVPVGAFLSGGIDSPLVAGKMQTYSAAKILAFTYGGNGDDLDESKDAACYASIFNLDHIIEYASTDQLLSLLGDVVLAQSEPFGDYSIFPTLFVSKIARQQVTVALSGDGGDELFWGYSDRFLSIIEASHLFADPYLLRSMKWGFKKYFDVGDGVWQMRMPTIGAWYQTKHSHLPANLILSTFRDIHRRDLLSDMFNYSGYDIDETAQWLRWNEFTGHLSRVLLKVDRASMYHSLEVRVPLLDKSVISTALQIDWRSCLSVVNRLGKLPLRNSLAKHSPYQTIPKKGFSVPMDGWLRGPLRSVFEQNVLNRQAILGMEVDGRKLGELFSAHLQGNINMGWGLWIILSLVLWEKQHFSRFV